MDELDLTYSSDKTDAILVDIDGTLAIHNGRSPYDYSKVSTDLPSHTIIQLTRLMHSTGYTVVLLSGRPDSCRHDTEVWLKHYDIPYTDLFMRTTGDHRKDYIIKRELFDAHVHPHYNIEFVLDDRNQVVEMWRGLGLTCLQVADGNF